MSTPFTMIPNTVFSDHRICNDTKVMVCYLMSRPKSWKLHYKDIMKQCHVGRNKAYNMIKEAIGAGYLERRQSRNSGLFSKTEYVLTAKNGQLSLGLETSQKGDVLENGTRSTDQPKPLPASSQTVSRYTVNGDTYKDLNSNTITTTNLHLKCSKSANFETGQGSAGAEQETASLRESLETDHTDLPKGKAHNDLNGRDLVIETQGSATQQASCQDKTHDNCSARLARAENLQQGQQASLRASGTVKVDILQNALKKMVQAAGAALAPSMSGEFEPERWLSGGYDLERDILPIIAQRCAKKGAGSVFSWKLFTTAIFERHQARTAPLPKVAETQECRTDANNTRKTGGFYKKKQENLSNESVLAYILKRQKEEEMELAA